jgi:adenine-specific DNA-methyltransferase
VSTVFIGGSRRLTHLPDSVRQRLDRIVEQNLPVLVGDANGADKAVQSYLHSRQHKNVTVFCTEGVCRNNVGQWPVRAVTPPGKKKDFRYYAAKDRLMAQEADGGFMLWDGESAGTLANVLRLFRLNKSMVVFVAPTGGFVTVQIPSDWEHLLTFCSSKLKLRVDREVADESAALQKQESLF